VRGLVLRRAYSSNGLIFFELFPTDHLGMFSFSCPALLQKNHGREHALRVDHGIIKGAIKFNAALDGKT
jgi:hypothetical protein